MKVIIDLKSDEDDKIY